MIQVKNLKKSYDRNTRVLHGVSFDLPDTGFVCILGPSGCGKTSLLNAIGGLDRFNSGTVKTDGLSKLRCGRRSTEAERNRSFGYIFQNYYLLNDHSVAYNVYLGLHALKLSHKEKMKRVREALQAVDMERYLRRNVSTLSGGQQQRVAIARALARRPRVIFADEPTGNLDEANTLNICGLLRQISRTSLVVMVTHETRIAEFYADRILRLEDGKLVEDKTDWERSPLPSDSATLYTGDYKSIALQENGLQIRYLQEEGAAPVQLTLLVQKNRIVLKLDDNRAVACGSSGDSPLIAEGERPLIRLEELDAPTSLQAQEKAPRLRHRSLPFSMLWREARLLRKEKGLRRFGTFAFLTLLTLLTLYTVGDYLRISEINREDFVTTDAHMLEVEFDRTEETPVTLIGADSLAGLFMDFMDDSGLDFDYVPTLPQPLFYSANFYLQMGLVSIDFSDCSYVPLSRLDKSTLIAGRMPEHSEEIVVDRWVLENILARPGILQNGIQSIDYFLGKTLNTQKKEYAPTIVGICDSGDPSVFLSNSALASVGTRGTQVLSVADFQQRFPELAAQNPIQEGECCVFYNNAGPAYSWREGQDFTTGNTQSFVIAHALEADTYAHLVLTDADIEAMLRIMIGGTLQLYCADKEAVLDYLNGPKPHELEHYVKFTVTDATAEAEAAYAEATQTRADSRSIVTLPVLLLSLVMLYLLQRSRVQERIGIMAVYRLLGIPRRKLSTIFAMESLMQTLTAVLPWCALVYGVLAVMERYTEWNLPVRLPWEACLWIYGGISLLHLLLSILPLGRLQRLPPAKLAAKYDF